MMYRIRFVSAYDITRRLKVSVGPWHEDKNLAEQWIDRLVAMGHREAMELESTSDVRAGLVANTTSKALR